MALLLGGVEAEEGYIVTGHEDGGGGALVARKQPSDPEAVTQRTNTHCSSPESVDAAHLLGLTSSHGLPGATPTLPPPTGHRASQRDVEKAAGEGSKSGQ